MGTLRAGQGRRRSRWVSLASPFHLHLNPLATTEPQGSPPMLPAAPILPEDGERPDDHWMQQHTHLTRLVGGAAIPLTLFAQRARATTANAGRIHDAQTAIGLSAPLMGAKFQACGTVQCAIGLEDKVLPREAARFPGQAHLRRSIARGGSRVR
jgi:hypothetical protein